MMIRKIEGVFADGERKYSTVMNIITKHNNPEVKHSHLLYFKYIYSLNKGI